ncbi:MAG: hypothetical protein ACTTKL_03705 [Treponema sp.]
MQKKHLLSLVLGILFILIGITIIPVGLYCSTYFYKNFPEVRFENIIQQDDDILEPSEERGFFESIMSIVGAGLDRLITKMSNIIQEQKQLRDGYNKSFYTIQTEIKYVMKMQAVYLIVTTIIISIFFIIFGVICLAFHALLIYQSKTYLLEEKIRNEIAIRGGKI